MTDGNGELVDVNEELIMGWEDPDKLLKFKFGREEYCQRMLTSLILAAPYPKWNSRNTPSQKGYAFLRKLYSAKFDLQLGEEIEFVDEFELPPVDPSSKGGAPDYAVIEADRLWIIELRTEVSSHRKQQMRYYERLARHHYPDKSLEMLYLTPEMPRQRAEEFSEAQFAHVYWTEILDLIVETWFVSEFAEEKTLSAALVRELNNLSRPTQAFAEEAHVIREAIRRAAEVQLDGKQRAVEVTAGGLEELMNTRIRLAEAIARDLKTPNVRPWIWYESTSGGKALTELGQSVGCELRLSKYREGK